MHRLGSVLPMAAPITFGPGTGTPANPANTWQVSFPADPLAKFLTLHIDGTALGAADRVEIDLGYDTDVFTRAWGPDFWSRPIKGPGPVTVRYVRSGASNGTARIDKHGRGEAIRDGGQRNSNGDLFMIDDPYVEPPYFPSYSLTAGNTAPTWQQAACVTNPVIEATARSVGMYVVVHRDPLTATLPEDIDFTRLSSCTATLIAPDLVITAGHCVASDDEIRTGAITFDFQTLCNKSRPPGYSPKFYKLKKLIETGYLRPPGDLRAPVDYTIMQIETPPGGLPIPPIPFRNAALPPLALDDPLFIVHHRRGTAKKVSSWLNDPNCEVDGVFPNQLNFDCSVDYGSSGSSVFDSSGRIVANLSVYGGGAPSAAIWEDVRTEPAPTRDVDVVVVLDRSGSMSLPGRSGTPKMAEAKQAAGLFVSLLTATGSHRVGLVSFSTAATSNRALANVNPGTKSALVGPIPPATGGQIGGLAAGGMTTIGGGLQTAIGQFPMPSPTTNTRAILLMTDGLENTAPMIGAVEPLLAGARLNVVGFGTPASLDGPRLTTLARAHDGIYVRADDGLNLKKYFALAFGWIFDLGTALDPEALLPAGQTTAAPVDVDVCDESRLTVVLGWATPNVPLMIVVRTPGGVSLTASTAGVEAASGETWQHLTVPLPFAGEHEGRWEIVIDRPGGLGELGEFLPQALEQRYFVSAFADRGPAFNALPMPRLYTGDPINPLVFLRGDGGHHVHAEVTVEIEGPGDALGELLATEGLGAAGVQDGDALDGRTSMLVALEAARGPLVKTVRRTETLYDDGLHGDGGLEPDGIYGLGLTDLTAFEGTYTFRAVATYGEDCLARREASWAVHVDVGIDGSRSDVRTQPAGGGRVKVTVTPRDRFGNRLGPGRLDAFGFVPTGPASLDGDPIDNGDGSYGQVIVTGPSGPVAPGVSIAQPDRPPTTVSDDLRPAGGMGTILGCRAELVILLVIVILLAIVVAFLIGLALG